MTQQNGTALLLERLDDLRARLSDEAAALPDGDQKMLLISAKEKIAMAQDLIEAAEAS